MTSFGTCLRLLPLLLALAAAPAVAQPAEVTTLADSGPGSLRQAVLDAPSGTEIIFAEGLSGTITLASEIVLDKSLTITGPGADVLALSGGGTTRLFTVTANAEVATSGLTLRDGHAVEGGAVFNEGTFTFTDGALTDNVGVQGGGAYEGSSGTLHLERVVLSGNEASGPGGALLMYSGTSTLINCTVYGNVAGADGLPGSGGGIANIGGTLTVTSSTLAGNEVLGGGEGGGIRTSAFQAVTTLTATLVSGNTAATDADISGDYTQTYSLIGDEATGLGDFGDHGGAIPTLALLDGSSAIDAIPTAECPTETDARGEPRGGDGDGNYVDGCDVGAFEAATTTPAFAVAASDSLYEDRVVLTWPVVSLAQSTLLIQRDGTDLAVAATSDTTHTDFTAVGGETHSYCVTVLTPDGAEIELDCDDGNRALRAPREMEASDALVTTGTILSWRDRSSVEVGYVVTRDGIDIHTTAANRSTFHDTTGVTEQVYEYCVAALDATGYRSPVSDEACDDGSRAALLPARRVSATDGRYPDAVHLTFFRAAAADSTTRAYVVLRDGERLDEIPFDAEGDTLAYVDTPSGEAGTEHEYCVIAYGVGGVASAPLCDTGFVGMLPPPTEVLATDGAFDDRVRITWTPPETANDGYVLYRRTTSETEVDTGFDVPLDTVGVGVMSYVDYTAEQEVGYRYAVAAYSAAGTRSALGDGQQDDGSRSAVVAPSDLTASDGDHEEHVALAWETSSTTVLLFKVYRDDALVATVPEWQLTYEDAAVASDVTHDYAVTAVTLVAGGEGLRETVETAFIEAEQTTARLAAAAKPGAPKPPSPYADAALIARVEDLIGREAARTGIVESDSSTDTGFRSLAPPSGVEATLGTDEEEDFVRVTWTDESAAEDSFRVYRRLEGDPAENDVLVGRVGRNRDRYLDQTAASGVRYTYSVRATDSRGPGGESAPDTADGRRTIFPPTNLRATDDDFEDRVELSWKDKSRVETGYRIYRTDADSVTTEIGTAPAQAQTFTDDLTGGTFGVSYSYAVRAFDEYGESLPADDAGGTVLLPPGSVSASTDYSDRVVLAWVDQSAMNTGYRIYRNGSEIQETGANATSYTHSTSGSGTYCVESFTSSAVSAQGCADGSVAGSGGSSGPPADVTLALNEAIAPSSSSNYGFFSRFGSTIDISGDYAIVGTSPSANPTLKSSAFIYERDGDTWALQQELVNVFPLPGTQFGHDVAIEGDWAFVADPAFGDPDRGVVSVYKRVGTNWIFTQSIAGEVVGGGVLFPLGRAIDVDGDLLLISGTQQDLFGRVEVYERDQEDWELRASVGAPTAAIAFGRAVAVSGRDLLIGDQGEAYLYTFDTATNDATRRAKLKPTTASTTFGQSVALHTSASRSVALVGDPVSGAGRVSVYEREGDEVTGTWGPSCSGSGSSRVCDEEDQVLTPSSPSGNSEFGIDLAVRGAFAIVGDPGAGGTSAGTSYLFRRGATEWVELAQTTHLGASDDSGGLNDAAGYAVALSSDHFVLGAPGYDADFRGAAFFHPIVRPPVNVQASDGDYADRIQVRWEDVSLYESGFTIHRKDGDGPFNEVGTVDANVEVYNDHDAPPGGLYAYRVTATNDLLGDAAALNAAPTAEDLGWLPPDGVLSGRIAAQTGAGVEDVDVCLTPSPNRALLLDGEAGRTERYGVQFPGDVLDAFTVELWVRGTGQAGLFSYATDEQGDNTILLYDTGSSINLYVAGESKSVPGSVLDGAWHHVSFTWSASPGGLNHLYVDGVQRPPGGGGIAPGGTIPSGGVLMLGQEQDAVGGGLKPNQALDGLIDEVRVWDRFRTEAEVQADYQMPLRGDEPGLVSYWPLDQGAGRGGLDATEGAQHFALTTGAHWAEAGAPLDICAKTDEEGNYTLDRIRYGEGQTFAVTPHFEGRTFTPAFTTKTLSRQSPVENEVGFVDVTAFTIAGTVEYPYQGTDGPGTCPAEGIELYADDVLAGSTEADGTFALAIDPSESEVEFEPRAEGHYFEPATRSFIVDADSLGVDFQDPTTFTFSGFAGGSCDKNVGTLTVHVFTENGCFDETFENVSSDFEFDLPPQEYLVEVTGVELADGSVLSRVDVEEFYDGLGTRVLDLTEGDATLDFIYRAPLQIAIDGLPDPPSCGLDVPVLIGDLGSSPEYPLTFQVGEFYGEDDICPVDSGTVTVYDEWSNGAGQPITLEIEDGAAAYTPIPNTPYVLEGRIVDGVDRSYQKALTLIAETEGRSATETQWAVVTGTRARTGTFVTAPSSPIPMWILHDPPGDGSYSYIEEGSTFCNGRDFDEAILANFETENEIDVGAETITGVAFGGLFGIEAKLVAGVNFEFKIGGGRVHNSGFSTCMTTMERFATSDADEFVGPDADVFIGMGLNYLFAESDKLTVDPATCEVDLETVLGVGIDEEDPIDTEYHYTRGHIVNQLLPQLEELETLYEASGEQENLTKVESAQNIWRGVIAYDSTLQTNAEEEDALRNHSFSAGATVDHSVTYDSTHYSAGEGIHFFEEFYVGSAITFNIGGNGNALKLGGRQQYSATTTFPENDDYSSTYGYVLSDNDVGDFFTVDVKEALLAPGEGNSEPNFHPGGEMIFDLRAGTSSAPWEPGTQARDNPVLAVNPPVRENVPPDEAALFTLTLGNDSESEEAREYVLASLPATNPNGASITLGSTTNDRAFFIQAGQAISVPLQVERGPTAYDYDSLGVTLYAAGDYEIWQNGGSTPRADTVFVSAHFASGCSPIDVFLPEPGWTLNRAIADSLDVLLHEFSLDSTDTGVRPTRISLAYRPFVGGNRSAESSDVLAGLTDDDTTTSAFSTGTVAGTLTPPLARPGTARKASAPASRRSAAPRSVDTPEPLNRSLPEPGGEGSAARDGWIIDGSWGIRSTDAEWPPANDEYGDYWAFPADSTDGTYEIAGVVECSTGEGQFVARTFSEPVPGQVDRKRPRVLGTPQPADGVLAPGDDVSITFDEAMDPASFVTTGDGDLTVLLRPVNADDTLGDEVAITATANATSLVIEPTAGWDALVGRFEATIDGVTDALGNPLNAEPALGDDVGADSLAWRFTVRQGFAWAADSLAFEAAPGAVSTFEASLVNSGPDPAPFTLEDVPTWLTASVSGATVPPGLTLPVTFTITAPTDPGIYEATVTAASSAGDTALPLTLTVAESACAPPSWRVDPTAFAYRMDVTAEVYLGDEPTPTDLDEVRVAAFVAGELRGTAPLTQREGRGRPIASLSIYSNIETGERPTFEVFDPASCTVVDGFVLYDRDTPVLAFEAGAGIGSSSLPAALRPAGGSLLVPLAAGHTQFSTNRVGPTDLNAVLRGVGSAATDRITGTDGSAQFTPGLGWSGSLTEITPGQAYRIELAEAAALTFEGAVADPRPVPLVAGWNGIGYDPDVPLPVDDALAGFAAGADDLVVGTRGFAQYLPGVGWLGTLETMVPGEGYQLLAADAGTLVYPTNTPAAPTRAGNAAPRAGAAALSTSLGGREATRSALTQAGPEADDCADGLLPTTAHAHSMVVTATLADETFAAGSQDLLLSVTDATGACRGRGRLEHVEALGRSLVFLMIYGDEPSEALHLSAFDPETGASYTRDQVRLELQPSSGATVPTALTKQRALPPSTTHVDPGTELSGAASRIAALDAVETRLQTERRTAQSPTSRAATDAFGEPTPEEPSTGLLTSLSDVEPIPEPGALAFEPGAVVGSLTHPAVLHLGAEAGRSSSDHEASASRETDTATDDATKKATEKDGKESGDGEVTDNAATENAAENGDGETTSETDVAAGAGTLHAGPPTTYELAAGYPNPFRRAATLRYALPEAVHVRLAVYDLLGREAAVLVDADQTAGRYTVRFEAGTLPSGVYIYILTAGDFSESRRLLLVR